MIAIIGRGNVATHLFKAFKNKTEVCLVNPHTLEDLPKNPDIILISVSDKAVGEVVAKLPKTEAIVAHTAGSVPLEVIASKFKNAGVFYPLQTFTKDVNLDYSEIPVFVEGNSCLVTDKLKQTAALFTDKIFEADSEKRKNLHLASVFACNFSNALVGIADDLLKSAALDYKVLLPLLNQTMWKLTSLSPKQSQTGPAVRGDRNVINAHLEMLENKPDLKNIYSLLSNTINPELKLNENEI